RTGPAFSAGLAVLVTLLFYRIGFNNYQMVFLFLISYWVVSEWQQLVEHSVLVTSLAGYFGLLALVDLVYWAGFTGDIFVIVKFLLGCALVVVLVQFSASRHCN